MADIEPKSVSGRHKGNIGARARAFKWAAAPGGLSTPGPGAYNIKTQMISGLIGGFSEARPKSDIEWACYRAAQTPGPQDYNAKKGSHVFGGKFNASNPRNFVEEEVYLTRHNTAPGQYEISRDLTSSGGSFSNARPKSDVDWKIFRAKQLLGPGDYNFGSSFSDAQSFKFQGRALKGNYQTNVPNAVLSRWDTIKPAPDSCRSDPSVGKQVSSKQRSMPSFSFGGGKTFDMHQKNIVDDLEWASNAEARSTKRTKKKKQRKQQADAMFERFFGYHPSNPKRAPRKPMMKTKRKAKPRKFVSPGPGAYNVTSMAGLKLTGPRYSFGND